MRDGRIIADDTPAGLLASGPAPPTSRRASWPLVEAQPDDGERA